MSSLRTFIAVNLPAEVVQQAQQLSRALDKLSDGVRWVPPRNMHLTLKFLGEVRENETYKLCQAMTKAVAEIDAFDIQLTGAGAFPSIKRPRSIWIGVGEGSEQLNHLFTAIDDAMADLSFPREPQRFKPHLTIGRVKHGGPWMEDFSKAITERADFHAGTALIEEVVLYSSELASGAPIYSPIGRSALRDPTSES